MTKIKNFMRDENAATSIEYAMIASLISLVILTALTSMGTSLNGIFKTIQSSL